MVVRISVSPANKAFFAGCLCCMANGFFYSFSIFSSEIKSIIQVSSSEVVILGVLSQAGMGLLQLPTTLALGHLQSHSRIWKDTKLDTLMNVFGTALFCIAMLGIGAVLYVAKEVSTPQQVLQNKSLNLGLLGLFFTLWGQAVGASYNTASSIVNYNHQDNVSVRRKRIASLAMLVGFGGVGMVILYYFGLAQYPLYATFFGLAVWFLVIVGSVRWFWMQRVMESSLATTPEPAVFLEEQVLIKATPRQPICALFTNAIPLLTFLNVFCGLGTSASMLSSMNLIARSLVVEDDKVGELTFALLITFLVAQVFSRLCNAVTYAYTEWPYVSAVWQTSCLLGLGLFLMTPTEPGAFASAWFVGSSFGGFHSGFPVLAATCFPGNQKVDYPQSLGVCMLIASLGVICIGQLATVVFGTANGNIYPVFIFYASVQAVSALAAFVLGCKIRRCQQQQRVANS
ncbi:hypothetical protein BASA81_003673 [Batrachochytrium salamandrivorans]|nr:hypothetical protein BASA81_003673 [Batrachochytrium salamandrivorans]